MKKILIGILFAIGCMSNDEAIKEYEKCKKADTEPIVAIELLTGRILNITCTPRMINRAPKGE